METVVMIIDVNSLDTLRTRANGKVVFAGGTFDLLHLAHVRALQNLRQYGDIVVIGVVSDKRVRERKGDKRPIFPLQERLEIIDSIRFVDYAFAMPEPAPENPGYPTLTVLEKLRPDSFITIDSRFEEFREKIKKFGTELVILPRIHEASTSRTIDMVLNKFRDDPV